MLEAFAADYRKEDRDDEDAFDLGIAAEKERLRPLLEKCEAIVSAQLHLNQGLRRPDDEAGALLGNLLGDLRRELRKEPT